MQAVIKLDVPEWQIGQPVTVYFPDTMQKQGVCELPKEQEAVPRHHKCIGDCYSLINEEGTKFCPWCGRSVKWE